MKNESKGFNQYKDSHDDPLEYMALSFFNDPGISSYSAIRLGQAIQAYKEARDNQTNDLQQAVENLKYEVEMAEQDITIKRNLGKSTIGTIFSRKKRN